MATGALDANGIWQYGEDDSEPTFSALLNKLGSSTSDTVTRLENLSGLSAAQYATHRDNLGVGLVNIIPSSVAIAGGTATVNSVGKVTFSTGTTSLSLNGVFSSAYDSYRIILHRVITPIAFPELRFRVRSGGTDYTSTSDYEVRGFHQATTSAGSPVNWTGNLAFYTFMTTGNESRSGFLDIHNPFTSGMEPSLQSLCNGNYNFNTAMFGSSCWVKNTGSFDGFSIFLSSSSMAGQISVLGYNTI